MFAYCLVINVHLLERFTFQFVCCFAFVRVSFVRLSCLANFVNNFFKFFQNIFSSSSRINFERRKRDLNPRAAINDLLPFQGSPFSLLGISPKSVSQLFPIEKQPRRLFFKSCNAEGGIRTHAPLRTNGFQDRLVMTTSIPLHIHLFAGNCCVPQCK